MSINQLVLELKENSEDYELYPSTPEMLEIIRPHIKGKSVLDIGCGTCNFYKYLGEEITSYYVMEKSKILLKKLPEKAIILGVDFEENTLIDKKVDVIFCNPPYSKFEDWTIKILSEGFFIEAFLIIPQRWKNNVSIMSILKHYNIEYEILGSFDFLEAERKARAKVDIIRFYKSKWISDYDNRRYYSKRKDDFDEDAFDNYFKNTFNLEQEQLYEGDEYQENKKYNDKKDNEIHCSLVLAQQEGKSKAQALVELYSEDFQKLLNNLNSIMKLDEDVMKEFGLSIPKIKEALKKKLSGLKDLYWRKCINELDEITSKLTNKCRNDLFNEFEHFKKLDFNLNNIYVLILWVVKNANKYYEKQIVDFFIHLSDDENVKPYKSNQKLFTDEKWRYNGWERRNQVAHILDYRIIMSSPFRQGWSGQIEDDYYGTRETVEDIFVIANCLGFYPNKRNFKLPNYFGEKNYVTMLDDKLEPITFMEYKAYKNKNMHVKFNIEFTKALNVEVSRILGWIKTKDDIKNEFPDELAQGAEKYFKTSPFISLENNGIKLLGVLQ